MLEFVFVLPILAVAAVLFIFFCKAMLSKQNVLLADRQLAWRQAKGLPDQRDPTLPPFGLPYITDCYFRNQPIEFLPNMPAGGWGASHQAEQDLVDKATSIDGQEAGPFAAEAVLGTFPGNVDYTMGIRFPFESAVLEAQFGRELEDHYYRAGDPWQRQDAAIWTPVRDKFINTFDNQLNQGIGASSDTTLVTQIRQLYMGNW